MKSCFDGYLTEGCKTCPDWNDGSDGSIGCATIMPIEYCPYFAKMIREEEMKHQESKGDVKDDS